MRSSEKTRYEISSRHPCFKLNLCHSSSLLPSGEGGRILRLVLHEDVGRGRGSPPNVLGTPPQLAEAVVGVVVGPPLDLNSTLVSKAQFMLLLLPLGNSSLCLSYNFRLGSRSYR